MGTWLDFTLNFNKRILRYNKRVVAIVLARKRVDS